MPVTQQQRQDLMRRVALMAEAFNRTLSDDLVGFWVDEQVVWALGLIVIGGAVLWLRGRDTRGTSDTTPASPRPPPPPLLPAPPGAPQFATPSAPAPSTRYGAPPIAPGTPSAPAAKSRGRPRRGGADARELMLKV